MLPIFTALLFGIFNGSAEPLNLPVTFDAKGQVPRLFEPHLTYQQPLATRNASRGQTQNRQKNTFDQPKRSEIDVSIFRANRRLEKNRNFTRSRGTEATLNPDNGILAFGPDVAASEKKEPAEESTDAADDPKKPAAKSPSANAILKQSRKDMNSLSSIRAHLDETISFGPKRFKAAGLYVQGTDLRLKLEYQLKLGASQGELLEVCDGQVLWTEQTIDNDVQVTRRDVRQILETAKNLPRSNSVMLHTELGLGGLPALLASLEETMVLKVGDTETVEKREFTLLEGRWNKEYHKLWSNGSDDPNAQLPPYVPDRVKIYMERIQHKNRTIHFPTRIVYRKKTDPEKSIFRPIVTLEFTKIVLDGKVAEDDFRYTPREGVAPVDLTQEYLQQLKPPPRKSPATSTEKTTP